MAPFASLKARSITGACLYACGIIALVFYGRALEQTVPPLIPESQEAIIFWSLTALPLVLWALIVATQNSYRLFKMLLVWEASQTRLSHRLAQCGALVLLGAMLTVTVAMPINIAEFSHFPIYAGQACLIFCALNDRYGDRPLMRAALTLLLTNVVSLCDEVAQYFHPTRFFDLRDLTLNFVGSLWGLLLFPSGKFPPHTYSLSRPPQ
jgi:O-antigen/teichoic acid export membrane protein